ncbi:MAG: hypothetical protein IPG67_01295 [Acidobacteria bacterium]|nr:hypothetical protein [Acidobacteriota bacterium]
MKSERIKWSLYSGFRELSATASKFLSGLVPFLGRFVLHSLLKMLLPSPKARTAVGENIAAISSKLRNARILNGLFITI